MARKQTAGRDQLGDFAPKFAELNDDVLFGENWNNEDIDLKTRSIITVVALMSSGITDSSEVPGVDCSNEWCKAVSEKEYVGLR